MNRRGFIGGLLALVAVPMLAKKPKPFAKMLPLTRDGFIYGSRTKLYMCGNFTETGQCGTMAVWDGKCWKSLPTLTET